MEKGRRKFIANGLRLGGLIGVLPLSGYAGISNPFNLSEAPDNEHDFWNWIRESYSPGPNLINLNNGGVSPQPRQVQDVFEHYTRLCNEAPSYYMWRVLDKGRQAVRRDLAALCGALPEEIAIQRNTTESMANIIFGLQLGKGDEVIVTKYDYPHMRNAWNQREKRDGLILKWVDIPIGSENKAELVNIYTSAFTERTKIVHLTHMINYTGHVLPVKEITAEAHRRGIKVVLDAAHTFCHVETNFHDLGCDYAGTSLHKWLCAPFGTGLLYIKKNQISTVWPLMPNDDPQGDSIIKFESLGTRSFPAEMGIGKAISFHKTIGSERKTKRLRFLKEYWVNAVKNLPGITFYSPLSPEYSCGICTVGFDGKKASELEAHLLNKYNVHTVAIEWEKVNGIRVTPNVYTSTDDLDVFIAGLRDFAYAKG